MDGFFVHFAVRVGGAVNGGCGRKKEIKLMNKKVLSNDYKWCLKCLHIHYGIESHVTSRLRLSIFRNHLINSAERIAFI